jgi:hypothetical protein
LIPIVPETENFADRPNSLSKSKATTFGGSESGLCAWAEKISAGKSVCYCAENDRVGVSQSARTGKRQAASPAPISSAGLAYDATGPLSAGKTLACRLTRPLYTPNRHKAKGRSPMHCWPRNAEKIRSFRHKDTLEYTA